MGRILHFLENCFLTIILAFGIFPITLVTSFCVAIVFHIKLAYTILFCLITLCVLIWMLYFCIQHESLLPWSWLRSHFGSYGLTSTRNLRWPFGVASTRIVQSIRSFKRILAPQLTSTRHKAFVPVLIVLASFLVIGGSIWIGIRVSRAVFSDTDAKETTQKNINANKNTPKPKTTRDHQNRNKSKSGTMPRRKN